MKAIDFGDAATWQIGLTELDKIGLSGGLSLNRLNPPQSNHLPIIYFSIVV